jgi:hypothetical protein
MTRGIMAARIQFSREMWDTQTDGVMKTSADRQS